MTPRAAGARSGGSRGFVLGALAVLVLAALGLFAVLSNQKPNDPITTTAQPVALAITTEDATAEADTPTSAPTEAATVLPTNIPTEAPTDVPTVSPEQIALTPVSQNASWSFVEHDFDGVMMVLVPAGCFMMGGDKFSDEKPVHEQCFEKPFWIDKYEVTNAQFDTLKGTASRVSLHTDVDEPRENITWVEARDFCALRQARLPTEREWEYAASGPSNLNFPWGNNLDTSKFVWSANSNNRSANVGSIPEGQSWVGALDLSGNVWEWTSSIYAKYPYVADDGREKDSPNADHVLRGGGWDNNYDPDFTTSARTPASEGPRGIVIGFRCARPAS
jgi:formylglycine-generating enzyme required for sulfatase activity